MDSSVSPLLFVLGVFRCIIRKDLIRSVHVYRFEDGQEKRVEREFIFSPTSYTEMQAQPDCPFFKLSKLCVSDFTKGRVFGLWSCIFAFNSDTPCSPAHFPLILQLSRNPNLKSIPTLADDIEKAFQLSSMLDLDLNSVSPKETCEEKKDQMLDLDLNSVSPPLDMEELLENQQSDEAVPEETGKKKKKKRAATEHVNRIKLSDLVKYFDLPIVEASRNLNVGLTVLKRKCRELGISRWPHRKIKSLDTLIHDLKDLQEDEMLQELENQTTAMQVEKRRKMLETEKECIERQPSMEIQTEIKKFRQDVFRRKHKARSFVDEFSSVSSDSDHH